MVENAQLLDAVLADPDSDEPRVAYAASLDNRDDERAEMIRSQIQVAASRRRGGDASEWGAMFLQAKRIVEENWHSMVEPITRLGLAPEPTMIGHYRGFIEHLEIDAATFLARAADIYAAVPLRHVTLTNVIAVGIEAVAECPHLGRLVSLSLAGNQLSDDDVRKLVSSPHIQRISWLDLEFNQLTADGVEAIAASHNLPRLAYLSVRGNPTPNPVEEFSVENGIIVHTESTELGDRLETTHGHKAWLHGPSRWPNSWPPDFETAEA